MTDNMKKFMEESSNNAELQEKLKKLSEEYFQTMISVAKEYGIELTKEEIAELLNTEEQKNNELSDEELNDVAGGAYVWDSKERRSDCLCVFGGGGSQDKFQKTCACVMAGCGELTEYGKKEAAAGRIRYKGSSSAPVAMYCALGGTGMKEK